MRIRYHRISFPDVWRYLPMTKAFDSAAIGSDIARNRRQYLARAAARAVVSVLGLNRPGSLATEIVQAISPVVPIETPRGRMYCKGGHGRLLWRARTFMTEEPETVAWLDEMGPDDVLWDIGANVGLYSIYASRFRGCRTVAFEPESQNFALLVENVALNELGERCLPICLAVSRRTRLGKLRVRYVTKGGAYNLFRDGGETAKEDLPESFQAAQQYAPLDGFDQGVFGCSIDDLVGRHGLEPPTHIKIDVDGIEPHIVAGGLETIRSPRLKSLLIELNRKSKDDMAVPDLLAGYGFKLVSTRSNWDSRDDRTRADDLPADNMIFRRD